MFPGQKDTGPIWLNLVEIVEKTAGFLDTGWRWQLVTGDNLFFHFIIIGLNKTSCMQ